MNKLGIILAAGSVVLHALAIQPARAQETRLDALRAHNAAMTAIQPTWMGPLIQSDPRLTQGLKLSVSNSIAPGAHPISYGNNHGISLIAGTRYLFEIDPPSFFRNHSAELHDGWGNASAQVKYRIASGNADHGNFAVTAILVHGFAPRAYQNGALSSYYLPKLAVGKAFGRFNVQSTVNGVLPTGKINQQGQAIEWNVTGQAHTTSRTWFDIEENAAFNLGGPFDGKTQNFITPAAFFMLKKKDWGPTHPVAVFDGGMQIATSGFYLYNHNLITEMRILF